MPKFQFELKYILRIYDIYYFILYCAYSLPNTYSEPLQHYKYGNKYIKPTTENLFSKIWQNVFNLVYDMSKSEYWAIRELSRLTVYYYF